MLKKIIEPKSKHKSNKHPKTNILNMKKVALETIQKPKTMVSVTHIYLSIHFIFFFFLFHFCFVHILCDIIHNFTFWSHAAISPLTISLSVKKTKILRE